MKSFNINDSIYIKITEEGWAHLRKTVGDEYIKHCIDTEPYRHEINGEVWYRLQIHSVFELLPCDFGGPVLFELTIMIDDETLK